MTAGRLLVLLFMLAGEAESCAAQVSARPMPRRRHLDAELPGQACQHEKFRPFSSKFLFLIAALASSHMRSAHPFAPFSHRIVHECRVSRNELPPNRHADVANVITVVKGPQ